MTSSMAMRRDVMVKFFPRGEKINSTYVFRSALSKILRTVDSFAFGHSLLSLHLLSQLSFTLHKYIHITKICAIKLNL